MEIVMPRWRSSGALSTSSNLYSSFRSGYLSCSTLVIAAVNVVLPWSMCPMVPMFMCGLVRSNFALATWALLVGFSSSCLTETPSGTRRKRTSGHPMRWVRSSLAAGLLDDLFGHGLGDLGVGVELHRVRGTARGLRPQVAHVSEHLRKRDERLDDLRTAIALIHGLDLSTAGVEVADHVAH